MEQSSPSCLKENGFVGLDSSTRRMFCAHCFPWRSANCPVVGEVWPSRALTTRAQSPTAQTLGEPRRRMSDSVSRRPFSCGAARRWTREVAELPTVQTMVPPLMNCPLCKPTPSGVARLTRALSTIFTPAFSISLRATSRRLGLISGRR